MHHDRSFTSDNISPISPEILEAILNANHGTQASYGNDEWSRQLTQAAQAVFECELEFIPVSTGTAANALALSGMLEPFECILCHESAHLVTDECGAIPFYSAGSPFLLMKGTDGKLTPNEIRSTVERALSLGIHHSKPKVLSIAQANEWGRVYTLDELKALCDCAHELGLWVHMDGARFGNALERLHVSPHAMSRGVGVDVLSLGATKNGAMAAEAVVSFLPERAQALGYRRKRAGLLHSKMRYLAAQWLGYFQHDHWRHNAARANQLAARLEAGLKQLPQVRLLMPVEANEIFVEFSNALATQLRALGFDFYDWPAPAESTAPLWRLVTRFDQSEAAIDAFLQAVSQFQNG